MKFYLSAAFLFLSVALAHAQPVGAPPGPPIQCRSSVVYDASTNGATELVPLATSKVIYVCGYTIFAGGTANVSLIYGTGTACASSPTKITPAYVMTTGLTVTDSSPFFRGLAAPASKALCINTSAGVAIQAVVFYGQY